MDGRHTQATFHARLLVLLAEHHPVAGRHLLDDQITVHCACGNPLYAGHLIGLLRTLHDDLATERDRALDAIKVLHGKWGATDVDDLDQLDLWERIQTILIPTPVATS